MEIQRENLDLLLLDVSAYAHMPPLGLLYIASYANSRGYNCKVKMLQGEYRAYSKSYLKNLLEEKQPFAVGLPVTAESLEDVSRYCRWIREYSDAKIMVGGPEATSNPEYVFEYTNADAVVLGDGEVRTAELLKFWKDNVIPDDQRGLIYKDNGSININLEEPLQVNLDQLPFPDHNVLLNPPFSTLSILTGRGCPYRCTFCFEGRHCSYRTRNINSVVNELKLLLDKKPKVLAFIDDTFTLDKNRVKIICKIIKENFKGPWFCEGRIELLYRHPEVVEILADAGLQRIQLGLESGSKKVLDAYKKGSAPEQIKAVFKHCHEAGITSVIGNFIVGGAFESNETFKDTLKIAEELIRENPGSAELLSCYLYPYKGTAVEEHPENFNLQYINDLHLYNAAGRVACINTTNDLSRGEISQFREVLKNVVLSSMLIEMDTLPPEKILKHFVNARDFGIQSEWYHAFLHCKPLALYARFQNQQNRYSWYEVKDNKNWLQYCPMRIGYNELSISNENLSVVARHSKRIELSGMPRAIYELSSGKLSIEEMLPYLRQYSGEGKSVNAFIKEVWECSELLAQDFLCIYSEV